MKKQENTEFLINQLKGIKSEKEANHFIKERHKNTIYQYFYLYLQDYVAAHSLDMSQIIKDSRINPNYVYQIINGKKTNIGRDYVLALCIAAGMNYNETNRGLSIAKAAILYPKDARDVKIVVAINQCMKDVDRVNRILENSNLSILKV